MKRIWLALIILMSMSFASFSQTNNLIPKAQKIKAAYEDLLNDPENLELQLRYINDFPENADIFKQVFHSPKFDQLYSDSYIYIEKLSELSNTWPDIVGNKLITICIGLKSWDADAIGHIQHATMGFANLHYANFIEIIKSLNEQDLNTLVAFLADTENHSKYYDFQKFTNKLKQQNEVKLYELFKSAKEKRIEQKDHAF
jgi:hypothetical protein